VRARVEAARAIQRERLERGEAQTRLNAHLTPRDAERICALDGNTRRGLAALMRKRGLSARAYAKILRVARTIADLEGCTSILEPHVIQATGLRVLERDEPWTSAAARAPAASSAASSAA